MMILSEETKNALNILTISPNWKQSFKNVFGSFNFRKNAVDQIERNRPKSVAEMKEILDKITINDSDIVESLRTALPIKTKSAKDLILIALALKHGNLKNELDQLKITISYGTLKKVLATHDTISQNIIDNQIENLARLKSHSLYMKN